MKTNKKFDQTKSSDIWIGINKKNKFAMKYFTKSDGSEIHSFRNEP